MTRWTLPTLALVLIVGLFGVSLGRVLGWSGSRASSLVSVVAQWLTAWALWSLAGGLAVRVGLLDVYEQTAFTSLALVGAATHRLCLMVRSLRSLTRCRPGWHSRPRPAPAP